MSELFFQGRKYLQRAGALYTIRDRESDDDYDPDEDWVFETWCGPAVSTEIQQAFQGLRPCQIDAIQTFQTRLCAGASETNLSLCTGAGKSRILEEITFPTGCPRRNVLVFPWLDLLTQYYKEHGSAYVGTTVRYLATEGTLPDVQKWSLEDLQHASLTLFTTYTSAPVLFAQLEESEATIDLICHDEAHRAERPEYAAALQPVLEQIRHTVNLSATLPESMEPHYRYPLLRGIKDGVVRDFHMELFMCVESERQSATDLLVSMVEAMRKQHPHVKMLIYTAEANTDAEGASSVKTFLEQHGEGLKVHGYWIEGIKADTKDRQQLLRDFEKSRDVSLLVSCKTLSEGIDLKGANCMLPWDPSASVVENIQRIGRVLRLYKGKKEQPPSTVLIPVFLPEAPYKACGGDREAINDLLCHDIAEGTRGNFRPIVNVCTALKSELAEEDSELFERLLNFPEEPSVTVDRDLVAAVAKHVKKPVEEVLEAVATAVAEAIPDLDEEEMLDMQEGEWSEERNGEVAKALAETQGITLVIKEGEEVDMFGTGETVVTLERNGDAYKVVKDRSAAASAKKRIAQRMRYNFSDDCKVLLGLEEIGEADVGGLVLTRLTTEVHDEAWDKRRLEWVAMYEKLGRCPSQISKDAEEKKAGKWQCTQRQGYRKNAIWMTLERIAILEDLLQTPGWAWEETDTWGPNRLHWIAQYERLGRKPSCHSKNTEEKRAGKWQSHQRNNYKKKEKCMTPERIAILEDPLQTPGWTWENEDSWEPNRLHWISQYRKLGHSPSQISKDAEEKRAGQWQSSQRNNYKKKEKCMTPERIAILEDPLQTPGWTWEEDTWEPNRLNWVSQYRKLGCKPSCRSKEPEEERAGIWQGTQRQGYKKKEKWMTLERIAILEDLLQTPGWTWENEDSWEPNRLHWIHQRTMLQRNPSHGSKNKDEQRAGRWQQTQRKNYKSKKSCMTAEHIAILEDPLQTPGWTWSSKDSSTESKAQTTRKRQPLKPKQDPQDNQESTNPQQRNRSDLEKLHQRYKTMNADTYAATVTAEEFAEYHNVADNYDARDPPERQPLNKIAALLTKFNRPSYTAIDLGCGRNHLRSHAAVAKMTWTSVDVHAFDETVMKADMGALPFEDESFDFAVLSRSLWARNHRDVLQEVMRILKSGGKAVICESFRRWIVGTGAGDTNTNQLTSALMETGFELVFEEGTADKDVTAHVFQYIIARKP